MLWVPRSTWPNWPITTQACKLGWWVRVEDLEEDDDNIRVVVKSLHQDEFHRRGTIGISGQTGLRTAGWYQTDRVSNSAQVRHVFGGRTGRVRDGGLRYM